MTSPESGSGRTSVVIPCYREDRYLAEAMQSVAEQSCSALELIVIDDGSPQPIQPPHNWTTPALHWIRTENRGLGAARNAGIEQSAGEFIAFLDADDKWAADKLKLQQACLDANPHAVACYTRCIDAPGYFPFGPYPSSRLEPPKMAAHLWRELYFPPSTLMVRAEVLRNVHGFAEGLSNGEDLEMYIKLLKQGSIVGVDVPLVWYRMHDKQVTNNEIRRVMGGKQARQLVIKNHLDLLQQGGVTDQSLWHDYRASVMLAYYRRNFAAARVMLWDYWKDHPSDWRILMYWMISHLPPRLVARIKD